MESELESMARSDVLRRYDEVMDVRVSADFREETYKHVLLPVYTTAYTYKGKRYHVLINGQSGKVEGDYPKSPVRLAGIVLAVVILLALLYWFSEGSGMQAETLPLSETEQTLETEAEGVWEEIWADAELESNHN